MGTNCGGGAAAGALLPVHLGDAVHNVDGVEGAGPGAVAVAQASELAQPVAAIEALDSLAALNALELVLLAGFAAGARTGNHSLHGGGRTCLNAHNRGNLGGTGRATGGTFVDGVAVLYDTLGIVGAARTAAGAAVGARQHSGDLLHPLIHRDVHEDGGSHQNHRTDQADNGNYNNSQ